MLAPFSHSPSPSKPASPAWASPLSLGCWGWGHTESQRSRGELEDTPHSAQVAPSPWGVGGSGVFPVTLTPLSLGTCRACHDLECSTAQEVPSREWVP